jgi:cerevisin
LNILSTWIGTETAIYLGMASPHTAGLLAYLLSLHLSKSFDPDVSGMVSAPVVQPAPQHALGTVFSFASAALPTWMSSILPPPVLGATIPIPLPTLTPAQLRKALLALATPDVLSTLPPNLLIFNNATDS